MGRWTRRAKRAFKQSGGLGTETLRAKQIAAIKAAGADEAYEARGRVTQEVLLGNIRKRRGAALGWLAENESRVLSRDAFDALETGVDLKEGT